MSLLSYPAVRCFLAIDLPESARQHLARVQDALRDPPDDVGAVSWVRRENWHVTLKFLGELADAELVRICEALRDVRAQPMTLCAERMVYFPRRGPVRVIAVEAGGDAGRLSAFRDAIEEACASVNVERDARRRFTGHITLGRSRHGERGAEIMSLRNRTLPDQFPGPLFNVEEFALLQSELHPAGSRYTKLATLPLRTA
jgi:2'-5' RNA ligase